MATNSKALIHLTILRDSSSPCTTFGAFLTSISDTLVPSHWNFSRSKRLFSARKDLALPNDVQLSATQAYGVIPQADFEEKVGRRVVKISMHLEKRRHVEKDDFVISMRSFQGGIERAWASGAIRSSYVVLKPESSVNIGYFAYLFKSHSYIRALQATADFIRDGQDLNFSNFCGVDLPAVPYVEQAAIVRFLDWAGGRLERAVRAKRKVIGLLNEQKQAIVHRAVTRGLDPTTPLRPSGIPWTGDIPQHWDGPIKIKHISSLKGRLGWQGLKANEYSAFGPAVVSSAHFRNQKISWDKCPHVTQERYEMDANIQLSEGDILLMKDGAAMGKLAFVDNLPAPACLNSHLLLFRPFVINGMPEYDPKFMFYFMLTRVFQDYVMLNGTGATFLGVSQEALGNYKICLPPIDEQRAVARFLDGETKIQDKVLVSVEEEIKLLREYRTRLVADVVTGKLDVREAAAKLPDEAAPEPVADDAELNIDPETAEEEVAL